MLLTPTEEIAMAIKTAGDVMKFAKDNKIEIVDLKFCDVPGLWQHFSVSANEFGEDVFEDGIGFDGSSIRGFQTIDESDMLLIPDPESAFLDPFADVPTVSLTCNVRDPVTGQSYTRDPRFVAQKAETFNACQRGRFFRRLDPTFALGKKQTLARLLDHLVGYGEQRRRHI